MTEEYFRAKWGSDQELDRDYQEKQRAARECDDAQAEADRADVERNEAAYPLTRELINIARQNYAVARIEATGTE